MQFQLAAKARGIIQADLARLCGVTPSAMTMWVAAKRPIPGRHICTISKHLGIPIGVMIEENEAVRKALETRKRTDFVESDLGSKLIYSRHKIESTLTRIEEPFNETILRIIGMELEADELECHRIDLRRWLNRISRFRVKQTQEPPAPKMFWTTLYDRPFGEFAVTNITCLYDLMVSDGWIRNDTTPEEAFQKVGNFYTDVIHCLVKGSPGEHFVQLL